MPFYLKMDQIAILRGFRANKCFKTEHFYEETAILRGFNE